MGGTPKIIFQQFSFIFSTKKIGTTLEKCVFLVWIPLILLFFAGQIYQIYNNYHKIEKRIL
jgi:hypothetical protein